ncbi:MAG: hypothetical protein A2418_00905 [Candidatus Brennerbacteria bacterium RIFOXYC1_FULL_41_11]|uniref:Uncharacterized protein n=1 Tax=Candidatus Brennerbacteria bacterium RIFOXYD1_FULL_41_16 TaxID=1797529 RepID=A0A1G1XLZ0_9BACT|nr:MAG: hypothetical protein A2391_03335 [Candidatus Brennerbacteria bacterium RIFOXYB1_FULL_41_13]OGY38861.1 MAG: hypothetical protein A2418_00905 [Candidatus Brennerbacteria bacterium RIFOXYC1_FULL_41_11]OGY41018.1 MAG: hypothetical protein A2570_00030 [Candidatus Brennerbacteria bacterium RIFOXYD1_FULL_41_16]
MNPNVIGFVSLAIVALILYLGIGYGLVGFLEKRNDSFDPPASIPVMMFWPVVMALMALIMFFRGPVAKFFQYMRKLGQGIVQK